MKYQCTFVNWIIIRAYGLQTAGIHQNWIHAPAFTRIRAHTRAQCAHKGACTKKSVSELIKHIYFYILLQKESTMLIKEALHQVICGIQVSRNLLKMATLPFISFQNYLV